MNNNNSFEMEEFTRSGLSMSAAFPALMRKVYVWMTLALAITGITAYGVATSPALLSLIFASKATFFGLIIAEFVLVFAISGAINRLSLSTATLLFVLYSVVNGATLSSIFLMFSMTTIGKVFFITAGTFAGLSPTIHAIKARKTICLANKETLVVAGDLICRLAAEHRVNILPVDSEHSAIFQSIVGEGNNEIEKILLTASGGPFRRFTLDQMRGVKAADALKHPTWDMGAKITIDSASMMNKGFEVIEAKWLFGVEADKIQVLVHPQSIVHSAVQFADGAVKAQLGVPDMRLPIQYAFSFPERLPLNGARLDLFKQPLEFFEPDMEKFRCLALAFESIRQGGNMPCIVNAANEIVNEAFRHDRCGFLDMADIIGRTMQKAQFIASPSYDDYVSTDAEARRIATEFLVN